MPDDRTAKGGPVHPVSELLLIDGEDSPEMLLYPGREWEWEPGFRCAERGLFFRRDGEEITPTHFSPLPGQTIALKD